MVSLEDMSQLMIERIVNIRNSGGEMITSHHQQQQPIENRRIKIITSWMSFDDKLFDKMNVQFILQNVSLFSVWILNPRSFFKINWNDDEFDFAFFFYFLLYNVTIDGRLMKFGHFFEFCALLGLSTATARHVDMFPPIGRPAETTCIDSDGENVWSASIRGTRSRHRDWRRSFLLSQSLVIIKMFISVWSFSFMQIQKSDDDDCWWMFCIWWKKKRARQFCPA
jgi:hypothetical protein